ncbi:MAG TPA: hypothetical protein VGD76_20730 [Ramlibacter sp.]
MKRDVATALRPAAPWPGVLGYLARCRGPAVPLLAVLAIGALLALMDALVDLDRVAVPKPAFKALQLPGYPADTPLAEAALVVESALWWLCLSLLQWLVALGVIGLCGRQLHRALRHDPRLARAAWAVFLGVLAVLAAALYQMAAVRGVSLLSFGPMVENLALLSPRFPFLASMNAALAFVASAALLCSFSLLLLPGAYVDRPVEQMRAITVLMYGGAALMLVWISSLASMYRLCATLMVKAAREPALALAPTISLMGGLLLSLLLAAAFLSAAAWLQHCHEQERPAGGPEAPAAAVAGGGSPRDLLAAHWPKAVAFLMPLLPGVAETVLQALANAP